MGFSTASLAPSKGEEVKMMPKHSWLVAGIATCLLVAACAPSPPKGRITLITQINFTAEPYRGTFKVTKGAEVLGCERGSFVDTPAGTTIHKELTCESGERSGTFTAKFNPQDAPGPGDRNGPWSIVEAADDFSGLYGEGEFWVVFDEEGKTGVETLTGNIQFSSEAVKANPAATLAATPKARLELRLGDTSPRPGLSEMVFPGFSQPVFLSDVPVITNADIACARVTTYANAPAVEITLIRTAAQKFCEITGATLGKPIGAFMDGKLVNVARIGEKFCDGRVTITGSFSLDEARRIAEAFPEGPPDALRVNSVRRVHELIELINSGDRKAAWTYAQRNFSPDFLKIPKEEHLNFISVTHDLTHGVESHGLQDCTANGVTALLKNKLTGSWLALDVAVEPQAPYRISGIALRPSQPPSFKQPAKKLTDARSVKELKAFMQTLVEADVFSGAVLLAQNENVNLHWPHLIL
jgi:hypothetical protein